MVAVVLAAGTDIDAYCGCHLRRRAGALRQHQAYDHADSDKSRDGPHLDHGSAHGQASHQRLSDFTSVT